MTTKQKLSKYLTNNQQIEEELRNISQWIHILKKISQNRFCAKHHQHRFEQECLDLIECMIVHQKHIQSTKQQKQQKLESFTRHLAIFHPQFDFSVAAYRKACELNKLLQTKRQYIIQNIEREKKKVNNMRFKDKGRHH